MLDARVKRVRSRKCIQLHVNETVAANNQLCPINFVQSTLSRALVRTRAPDYADDARRGANLHQIDNHLRECSLSHVQPIRVELT